MSRKVVTFQVDIHSHRASTSTIEKCIQSSIEAVIGFQPNVLVTQTNDRLLDVTIITDTDAPRKPGLYQRIC